MGNKEVVVEKLFDLYVNVCSLRMNKKTKTPSVNMTQNQAMEILAQLNDIVGVYDKKFVMYDNGGERLVKVEEI